MKSSAGFNLIERALPVPDDDYTTRRAKFLDGLRFRAVVSAIFLAVFGILEWSLERKTIVSSSLLASLLLLVFLNLPYWLVGRSHQFPLRHFYLHWLVDLILISTVLFSLGGINVPYGFIAYLMIVVTSATFISKIAAFIVASGASLATFVLGFIQLSSIFPAPDVFAVPYPIDIQIASIIFAAAFYLIFAYLAGTLADQLKQANAALDRARTEIENQNRELERKVIERTLRLERQNSEIQEFVHIVTHDLRNVLVGTTETARRLFAIEKAVLSEKGRRYVDNLLNDTRSMSQMLQHLLALFRVDRQEHVPKEVSLEALVTDILKTQGERLLAKGIDVRIANGTSLIADEVQMRHVLANLIDNAVKYVGDKVRPAIVVSARDAGDMLVISVEDNGIGIPDEQRDRIFQLYHRSPNQTVAGVEQAGEGVGLAISKRVVERWGGRIWVESAVGAGSRFSFSIPYGPTQADVKGDRFAER